MRCLKMDLFKMRKFKSTYIILLIALILSFLVTFATMKVNKLVYDMNRQVETENHTSEDETAQEEYEESDINLEMNYQGAEQEYNEGKLIDYLDASLVGSAYVILITVYVILFCGADYKMGYNKNVYGQISHRAYLILSKLSVCFIYTLIMHFVYCIGTTAAYYVVADSPQTGAMSDIVMHSIMLYVINIALASLFAAIAVLLKGSGIAMAIGVIISMGIHLTGLYIINMLVEKYLKIKNFDLSEVSLLSARSWLITGFTHKNITHVLILAVIYFVVATAIAISVETKRDIN
jgi:ABC-2 type transport system permease protein